MEPEVMQIERETRSSIEVSRNAKNEYSWKCKAYFGEGEEEDALVRLRAIEIALRQFYLEGGAEVMADTARALGGRS